MPKTTAIIECINLAQIQLDQMNEQGGIQSILAMDATLELAELENEIKRLSAEVEILRRENNKNE